MTFIGMQHDQLPRLRISCTSAVLEALHARERDADRVGIVTVGRKSEARKAGFDALEIAGSTNNPIFFIAHAQVQITSPNAQSVCARGRKKNSIAAAGPSRSCVVVPKSLGKRTMRCGTTWPPPMTS